MFFLPLKGEAEASLELMDDCLEYARKIPLDGATNLSVLELDNSESESVYLLFTDGLSTMSNGFSSSSSIIVALCGTVFHTSLVFRCGQHYVIFLLRRSNNVLRLRALNLPGVSFKSSNSLSNSFILSFHGILSLMS